MQVSRFSDLSLKENTNAIALYNLVEMPSQNGDMSSVIVYFMIFFFFLVSAL